MDELEKEPLAPEDLDDEAAIVDPDLLVGDDEAVLDDDEVDPFKDKWEE